MVKPKEVNETVVTKASGIDLVRVYDMKVSEKIQKNGYQVQHITGGMNEQPTQHYFKFSIEGIKDKKDREGKLIFTDEDVSKMEVVKEIEKTVVIDTGLKQVITAKTPEKPDIKL